MGDWISFVGMVSVMFSYVGLMVVSKAAIETGMSIYVLNLYSAALSAAVLFPFSFFHRRYILVFQFSVLWSLEYIFLIDDPCSKSVAIFFFRSSRLPISFSTLFGFFLLGVVGYVSVTLV